MRGSCRACLAPTSAGRWASVTVQPGVRARPHGAPRQAAVPEPQGQDPILWAWPGAQVAAELPALWGTLPRAAMETPAPKPQETGTVGSFSQRVCGFAFEETDTRRGQARFPERPQSQASCLLTVHTARSRYLGRADERKGRAVFFLLNWSVGHWVAELSLMQHQIVPDIGAHSPPLLRWGS